MSRLFPLPPCLTDKCSQEDYTRWLYRKASAHVKRDKKRGNAVCDRNSYRRAIHAAVCQNGHKDAFTGEELHWNLISKYDNTSSKAGKRGYKKQFDLLPTVDHLDEGLGEPRFAICGWRTNDCKGDLSIEELTTFCRTFLENQQRA